ncbi:MAG: tetratricopeptide repeat protein [Chthonomonadaceae bacterium]|nr:tetratricopeptide repeat protein [Chthonomonadaceae bacterium]
MFERLPSLITFHSQNSAPIVSHVVVYYLSFLSFAGVKLTQMDINLAICVSGSAMPKKSEPNRYVLLTEIGLNRLHTVRRIYKTTVADVIDDIDTPSVNTVKRALRREPVFVSTLERLWDYFQRRAMEKGETLPYLVEGKDYLFVEASPGGGHALREKKDEPDLPREGQGWISRQTPRFNRLFTGRRDILDRLHTALKAGSAALVTDPQALTGLGGIGKTQTAIAYIYEHRREYDYIFWVGADTVETLEDGLASLAEELTLLTAVPAAKKQALALMHDWFRTHPRWLLVIDNADDLKTLSPHLPPSHIGHVLFTTRAANTVRWAAPIPVVKFGQEEGALLLLRRAGIAGVGQILDSVSANAVCAARDLCVELDGLPLALDQAGAYLAETRCTVEDYHALYREAGLRLLDSAVDPDHVSVTVTFTLALAQIAECSPYGAAAAEMVRLCAFLNPDAIPEAIFAAYPFDRSGAPAALDGESFYHTVCTTVCSYSLAMRNPENRTITVHRLVQKVIRDTMDAEARDLWARRTVHAVSAATPDFEYEDWSLCDLLLPQWRLCAQAIQEGNIETAEAAYLLYQSGRYLRARALYEEARSHLQSAVAIAEKVHGMSHRITADYLDDLACLLRVLDRRSEAEALHLRAVAVMEQAAGRDHYLTASKLHNLAVLYVHYEEYPRATEIFLRALAIYEQQPSPDSFLIAATLTQLAGGYRIQGRFDVAETTCRRALKLYESLLAPDHIEIATACNNLALLYLTMTRYEEAEKLYLRALKINEQGRGKEHPETAVVVWGLARVRWRQNRIAEADALFQRAIAIYSKHFDPGHARVSRILSNYATFQQETMSQV